jgi:hypothetical protein
MLTSYNGWPASKDQAEIKVRPFAIAGTELKYGAQNTPGLYLLDLPQNFMQLIEPIDEGKLDDWAYAFRMVRGTTDKLSCHSSGTAIDLNATQHALGKVGTFPAAKVPMIQALAKKYGLRWGGDYRGRKDEMHFEVIVTKSRQKNWP